MFSRRMLFLPLLAGAVGVPYALTSGVLNNVSEATSAWFSSEGKRDGDSLLAELPAEPVEGDPLFTPAVNVDGMGGPPPPMEGPPVQHFAEVFHFNATPQWVTSRWGRVSTVLSELEFEGMRVPLVTGPRLDDVAGSLTYYFDKDHHVRRLSFDGTTGDPRRLAALAQEQFGLKQAPTLEAGLYVTKWNGTPRSALLISHPAVIHADRPMMRYNVKMEINLPSTPYKMSREFERLLDHESHTARW
ncbi:MAG: hypothetical protein RIC55_29540 [Pirellulaceae bacterium]